MKKQNIIAVCDIENRKNGDVIAIGSRILNRDEVVFHTNWGEWLEWCEREKINRIYAHNGGGWDWLSLLHYLMGRGITSMNGNIVNTRLIMMLLPLTEKHTLCLADSWCLWQTSLDKVAKAMIGKGKVAIDELPEDIYKKDRNLFFKYLKNDVDILAECMNVFMQTLHLLGYPDKKPPITIASCALKTYLNSYAKNEVQPFTDGNAYAMARNAYHGGRVYPYKHGVFDNINVFDINSLYPTVMRYNIFPYTTKVSWTNKPIFERPGVFEVDYEEPYTDKPAFMFLNGKPCAKGKGIFYSPELAYLVSIGGKVDVKSGYHFVDNAPIFTDYIDRMYSERLKNSENAMNLVAKMMMNHLYGKFAEKPIATQIIYIAKYADLAEKIKHNIKLTPIGDDGWYTEESEREIRHGHVGISGMVTSYAWVYLHRMMPNDTIYIDTDSIHTQSILPTGKGLGELKLEITGKGVYIGKKTYAIMPNDGIAKIRAKGVSLKTSKNPTGADISFDDMIELLGDGKTLTRYFYNAPTLKETISGIKPCRLGLEGIKRKRTIRLT